MIICDKAKLDGKRCDGAPDMVIEILSPSTAKFDRLTKFNKYLQAGIREYWIVDPKDKIVTVNILEDGKYNSTVYEETDIILVHVLTACRISLPDVFVE